MHLPVHACERCEIVDAFSSSPGQPVAAVNAACHAGTQRHPAIAEGNLRDGPEQEFGTASMDKAVGMTSGASRVRTRSASRPGAVAKLKTRSVVATSDSANRFRSVS